MLSTQTSQGLQAPGAGTWFLQHHWPRPVAPMYGDLMPCFSRGYGRGMKLHGMSLDTVEMRTVDGFVYGRPHLVGTKPGAPLPSPALFFCSRDFIPPSARARTAGHTSQTRPWRAETKLWNEAVKPRNIAKHRALQSIEVETLEDPALISHLRVARDHLAEMMETHGRFTVASLLPVGAFLAYVASWSNEGPGAVLNVLQGSAPVSAGRSAEGVDPTVTRECAGIKAIC